MRLLAKVWRLLFGSVPHEALPLMLLACGVAPIAAQVNSPQIPVTGNLGAGGNFPTFNGGSLVFSADANRNMVYPETSAFVIKVISTASLTATRNLIAPNGYYAFSVQNATSGGQSIQVIGASGTGCTIANGSATLVLGDGVNYICAGSSGASTVYPGAGIGNSTGSTWGTSYSSSNTIPANFLASIPYSQLTGSVPTWNQSTTGNAATATNISTSGTANQVWGMNSGATAQGWQTVSGSGTVSNCTTQFAFFYAAVTGTTASCDPDLTDNGTVIAATKPITITGSTHGLSMPAGTAVSGSTGSVVYSVDATNGYAEVNENNTGLDRLCSTGNAQCAAPNASMTISGVSCALGGSCAPPVVCAGSASPCYLQQINPTTGATTTTSSITGGTTAIPVASCASFTFAPGSIIAIENVSAVEWMVGVSCVGTTLTVTRGFYGTTAGSYASGATVAQMTTGYSTSATSAPYFYTLGNGAVGYNGSSNVAANQTAFQGFTTFNGGVTLTGSLVNLNGGNATIYSPQATFFEPTNPGTTCNTFGGAYQAYTGSNSWFAGGTNQYCTTGTNLVPPNVYAIVPGSTSALPTTGAVPAVTITKAGVVNVPTGGNYEINGVPVGSSINAIKASQLVGVTPGVAVVAGSSATGTTDSAGPINTAIAAGNVHLVVDSGFALSTALVLASNTWIECTSPQFGFIMQATTNIPVLTNANRNAPTTADGTGGFVVSNQTDQNIKVTGCMLNANSTQAVTGTNGAGVAHAVNPSTGVIVNGVEFTGVNGLTLDHDEVYDPGAYAVAGANDSNVYVTNSYLHNPVPKVAKKNTAGVQFVGPDLYMWVQNDLINSGDDAIAFNAEDCNLIHSGFTPLPVCAVTGWKWGQIQHVHINHNTLQNASFGIRLLDANELLDDVEVSDTAGNVCGNAFTMQAYFPSAVGLGNIGRVNVDGWRVQTDGTCNDFSFPYNFFLGLAAQQLSINHVQYVNPAVNWPLIYFPSALGTIGTLDLHDWDLTTATSTFSDVVVTNGPIGQVNASGLNWNDSVGTGNFFSGSTVPSVITVSNYAGPNLLLASGYAPATENGDAFTNTYAATTVFLNTTFNEHTSGTALAGTTPATCVGCTTAWVNTASSWTYGTNLVTSSTTGTSGSNSATIATGHANGTFRVAVSSCVTPFGCELFVRETDSNNYVYIYMSSAGTQLFNVTSGTQTQIGSTITGTSFAGNYTVVMSGTAISLTTPNGSTSGTTANTGTIVGMNLFTGSGTPYAITSMSLKSF
jgi:hypothetical protein